MDDDGDPKVTSTIDDVHLTVFFYGCDHGRSCQSITFQSAFHVDGGVPLEKINAWNRDKRFLKTWLDKVSDPFCEMDIDAEAGLTPTAAGELRRRLGEPPGRVQGRDGVLGVDLDILRFPAAVMAGRKSRPPKHTVLPWPRPARPPTGQCAWATGTYARLMTDISVNSMS